MITRTHTKTYALMDAWASTVPHDRLLCRGPIPCDKGHVHAFDVCAAPQCTERLEPNEVCYAVTQLGRRPDGRGEQWVCWRHVRPDDGPVRI